MALRMVGVVLMAEVIVRRDVVVGVWHRRHRRLRVIIIVVVVVVMGSIKCRPRQLLIVRVEVVVGDAASLGVERASNLMSLTRIMRRGGGGVGM